MSRIDAHGTPKVAPPPQGVRDGEASATATEVQFVRERPGRDELALAALGFDGAFERLGIDDLIARLERSAQRNDAAPGA